MITSDAIQPNTKIKRAIIEQKIDEIRATAYDLRLCAEVTIAQAEVYEGKARTSLKESAAESQLQATSAEAGIRRLIELRDELPAEEKPEPKAADPQPPAEDPKE